VDRIKVKTSIVQIFLNQEGNFHMNAISKLAIAGMIVVGLFLVGQPATAHHSGSEFGGPVTEVTGTVKEFQFKNPHSWIQVMVKDPKTGKDVEWSFEWGSPNNLGRQGYRPSTFPPGAQVSMRFTPMKNGSPAGLFQGAKFADGKVIGRWADTPAAAPTY
jgi:hypothetical protein